MKGNIRGYIIALGSQMAVSLKEFGMEPSKSQGKAWF